MCNIERRSEYNLITLNMVTQKQLIIVSSTFLTKSKPWRNHLCFFCISNVVTLSLFHCKANAHETYIYRVCKKVVVRGIRILPTYSIFSRCFHDLGQNLQQRNVKEFSGPMDIQLCRICFSMSKWWVRENVTRSWQCLEGTGA